MEIITSRTNPLCTHFHKLASSRSYRERSGECLCDSPKLLKEAELWGQTVTAVLYTEGVELPPLSGPARVVRVTESVMRSVSPMETPQGVVFSCLMGKTDPPEHLESGRYLLLDGVQDPGNVGTILRTADAFGWTVVLLPGCADLYNPKTLRAGMGVQFRRVSHVCSLEQAAELVKGAGLPLYATALMEDTADVRDVDLSACAVVIGSEGRGISKEALALCDRAVKIPMRDTCESLNAAVAAAVVLWEGARSDGRDRGC